MHENRTRWARLLREQCRSGLTIVEFCRSRGLAPSSFHRWRRLLTAGAPMPRCRESPPAFIEIAPQSSGVSAGIVFALRGGRRLKITPGVDESWVARFVLRLERLDEEAAP